MRDAISLLELCAGSRREITPAVVEESVGLSGRGAMLSTVEAVANKDYDTLFAQINEVVRSSKDILVFWQDLISVYRDMLVIKATKAAASYLDLTDHETEQLRSVADRFRKEALLYHCRLLEDSFFAMQKANAVKRVIAEMTLVRMCDEALDTSNDAILSRVARLEEQMVMGKLVLASPPVEGEANASAPKTPLTQPMQESSEPKAPVRPAAEPTGKRVLRRMQNWMEVVERIGRSTPMEIGFVKKAQAFLQEDGTVLIRFDSEFSKTMMENGDSRDRLRAALSAVLKREVGDRMLLMETAAAKEDGYSVIDEIIESSEEI